MRTLSSSAPLRHCCQHRASRPHPPAYKAQNRPSRSSVVAFSHEVESARAFEDEEVQYQADETQQDAAVGEAEALIAEEQTKKIAASLPPAEFSKDPPGHRSGYVAIIGRPNAGKSTLLNALIGQKLSIVSPKAQTTRHRILGIISHQDYQMVLLDTPGVIVQRRNVLESRMMTAVRGAMRRADALVAVVDATDDREEVLAMVQPPEQKAANAVPILVMLNKVDLLEKEAVADAVAWWKDNCRCEAVLPCSALRRSGLREVLSWMTEQIPEGPSLYPKDQVAEHPQRFFVAEIVREHVFHQYGQEVPYCVQVNVLNFSANKGSKRKCFIRCELVCERDSQKGILLGRRGSAMKALASAARLDIEEFLEEPIFLQMQVRHDPHWRRDAAKLKTYGY